MSIRRTHQVLSGGVMKLTCMLADASSLLTDHESKDASNGSTCHIIDARDIAKLHEGKWISMKDGVTVYAE